MTKRVAAPLVWLKRLTKMAATVYFPPIRMTRRILACLSDSRAWVTNYYAWRIDVCSRTCCCSSKHLKRKEPQEAQEAQEFSALRLLCFFVVPSPSEGSIDRRYNPDAR